MSDSEFQPICGSLGRELIAAASIRRTWPGIQPSPGSSPSSLDSANLAYVGLSAGGFSENGGAAALRAGSQITDATFTTLGLRASTNLNLGGVNATARGTLGWRHAFGDTTPLSIQAFSGGNAFAVAGVPIAQDAAIVETGLDLNLSPAATMGLSYTGQLASSAQQHGFKPDLAVRF